MSRSAIANTCGMYYHFFIDYFFHRSRNHRHEILISSSGDRRGGYMKPNSSCTLQWLDSAFDLQPPPFIEIILKGAKFNGYSSRDTHRICSTTSEGATTLVGAEHFRSLWPLRNPQMTKNSSSLLSECVNIYPSLKYESHAWMSHWKKIMYENSNTYHLGW